MTLSERIRRGFHRIGVVGVFLGVALSALFVWNAITTAYAPSHASCAPGRGSAWDTVELPGTSDDAAHLERVCGLRPIDWADALVKGNSGQPYDYSAAVEVANLQRSRYAAESRNGAVIAAICGAAWYAIASLISWLIRGFLSDA